MKSARSPQPPRPWILRALLVLVLLAVTLPAVAGAPVPVQAAPGYTLTDGLQAYWNLNETGGTRADSLGSSDLTPINGPGYTITGTVGNAAGFEGSASMYLKHADNTALSVGAGESLTLLAWVYLEPGHQTAGTYPHVISKSSGAGGQEYGLFYGVTEQGFALAAYPDGTVGSEHNVFVSVAGASQIEDVGWFLVARYNATAQTLSLQVRDLEGGVYSDTVPYTLGIPDGANDFNLGGRLVAGQYWSGAIDEVGVWNRAISDAEIDMIYGSGHGCTYPFADDCDSDVQPGVNLLHDGNMEDVPIQWWVTLPEPIEGGSHSRRLFPGSNILTRLQYGAAACGSGMQVLGYTDDLLSSYRLNPIGQWFTWSGGTMHLRYSVRGRGLLENNASPQLNAYIESDDGTTIYPLAVVTAPASWTNYTDQIASLPAGFYRLVFDMSGEDLDRNAQIMLDDVSLGSGLQSSACTTADPTPTPNTTRTPTPTRTATLTPTTGPVALVNCGFESGTAGWNFFQSSRLGTSGGPSGPAYAIADQQISQYFNWPGGLMYLQMYVRGPVRVTVGEGVSGVNPVMVVDQTFANWTLIQKVLYKPSGYGLLTLSRGASGASTTANFDGVQLSVNGYTSQVCSAPTSTPTLSPTPGATSTHIGTRTPGPSPTLSATPRGTRTTAPSGTPQLTYTPRPSSSPRPTGTHTDPELTATAQGTPVASYTPFPSSTPGGGGGGGGGGTCDVSPEDCPVPPQPNPGPYSDCQRPLYFWEVAQWVDYTRCSALTYISWTSENTEDVSHILTTYDQYEPMGTFRELREAVAALNEISASYNWSDMGLPGTNEEPNAEMFTELGDSIWNGAPFSLAGGGSFSSQCDSSTLASVVGARLATSMCYVFNILHVLHLMPWLQFFINAPSLVFIALYIWRKFIDKAS